MGADGGGGRVFGGPLHRGAWVVPVVLVGSGWMLVDGVGLSRANRAWTRQFAHRRDALRHVDDVTQYVPAALALGLKLAGVPGATRDHLDFAQVGALSALCLGVMVNGVKALRLSYRPDGHDWKSFVSGHTATAFWGAELLRREYGGEHPWLAACGYGLAMGTGFMRIYHRKHWVGDVIAGAGVGVASVWLGELLHPYLDDALRWRCGGRSAAWRSLEVSWAPMWHGRGGGVVVACRF